MELGPTTKVFLQLQPNKPSLDELIDLQEQLNTDSITQLVSPIEIHLTVIHIGALHRIAASLHRFSGMHKEDVYKKTEQLVQDLERIAEDTCYEDLKLEPKGFDYFGTNKDVGVLLFKASEPLVQLHTLGLSALSSFLVECGVSNPHEFMKNDANLSHSLRLTPHVTLVKSYTGPSLTLPRKSFLFRPSAIIN